MSAIEVAGRSDEGQSFGTITQLPRDADLEICGEGFNERTVKVRCADSYYFVFRDDLELGA